MAASWRARGDRVMCLRALVLVRSVQCVPHCKDQADVGAESLCIAVQMSLLCDELVGAAVAVAVRGFVGEAVRLAGCTAVHHVGRKSWLRCVLQCCIVHVLLPACGAGAVMSSASGWTKSRVARRVVWRVGAGMARGCCARGTR